MIVAPLVMAAVVVIVLVSYVAGLLLGFVLRLTAPIWRPILSLAIALAILVPFLAASAALALVLALAAFVILPPLLLLWEMAASLVDALRAEARARRVEAMPVAERTRFVATLPPQQQLAAVSLGSYRAAASVWLRAWLLLPLFWAALGLWFAALLGLVWALRTWPDLPARAHEALETLLR